MEPVSLSDCPIFEDIDPGVVDALCTRGRVLTFDAGDMLFERGQDAGELMLLREGVVELVYPVEIMGVTRNVTMQRKEPGDVVAWSAMVRPYRFTLSARCASHCTLVALSREGLHGFFETDSHTGYLFLRNLADVIGRRLQAMQTIWMHDIQSSAVRRLG